MALSGAKTEVKGPRAFTALFTLACIFWASSAVRIGKKAAVDRLNSHHGSMAPKTGGSRGRSGSRSRGSRAQASKWDGRWTWSQGDGWSRDNVAGEQQPTEATQQNDEETAQDRAEMKRLSTLQTALKLTVRSSGCASAQAASLRGEIDEGWEAVRAGLSHSDRVKSLDGELEKLTARMEVLSTKALDLKKEADENEAEIALTSQRLQLFKEKKQTAEKALRGQEQPDDDESIGPRQELLQMRRAMLALFGALGSQAPQLMGQLPPDVLATLSGTDP